jgi:hypothetical protein
VSLAEMSLQCVERALAEEVPNRVALYDRASPLVGRFPDRRGARHLFDNAPALSRRSLRVSVVFAAYDERATSSGTDCSALTFKIEKPITRP